jgi:teichoic acid transport system ATP-binding protein
LSFPVVSGKSRGYAPAQVDGLIARARRQYENPALGLLDSGVLQSARFELVAEGYEPAPVDAAIARIADRLEQPVSTFSTGMRARLYFSISTAVPAEILLIDEALATGDERFRTAAIRRMRSHFDAAQAILIVSHSMETIQAVATRAIWIDEGRIRSDGDPHQVVAEYQMA